MCWYPSAGAVKVDFTAEAVAHVSQVHRCGSGWACPVCAPVIRQSRAAEVDEAIRRHLDAGGGAEFVTLTVPHYAADALAPRLRAIRRALGQVLNGRPWQKRASAFGYLGAIRAVEVTYGWHGWHPHLHAVLLFERALTDAERADMRSWMVGRWAGVVAARGWGKLSGRHGVDVRQVTADGLGDYVTKVENGWTAGAELARGDLKSGGKGWTPFRLLYELASTGEVRWLRLWTEYEEATRGGHYLEWSRGLRARLLGDVEDKSDVERAASEGGGSSVLRVLVEAEGWRREVRAGTVGLLLDSLEDRAAVCMGLVLLAGHELRPIDTVKGGERCGSDPPSG